MCFVAGTFGVVPLCVHTIAYNLIPLLFMIPLGIGLGLAVRMGSVIAAQPDRAKLMASWCLAFVAMIALIVALGLYQLRMTIISLFSMDEAVIQGCLGIWLKVSFYIFVLYIFSCNSAILRALGMQWAMAVIMFACLWCGTLPAVVFFAMRMGGGLNAEWTVLPIGYTIMQVILVMSYVMVDWEAISYDARQSLPRAINESVH
jgi:Na+-driven multidrug efflux pump